MSINNITQSLLHQLNNQPVLITLLKHYSIKIHTGEMQCVAFFIKDMQVSEAVFSGSIQHEQEFKAGIVKGKITYNVTTAQILLCKTVFHQH